MADRAKGSATSPSRSIGSLFEVTTVAARRSIS